MLVLQTNAAPIVAPRHRPTPSRMRWRASRPSRFPGRCGCRYETLRVKGPNRLLPDLTLQSARRDSDARGTRGCPAGDRRAARECCYAIRIGALRPEAAAGFARLERQITESRVDVIRWSFLFWTGQCFVMIGFLLVFLSN